MKQRFVGNFFVISLIFLNYLIYFYFLGKDFNKVKNQLPSKSVTTYKTQIK